MKRKYLLILSSLFERDRKFFMDTDYKIRKIRKADKNNWKQMFLHYMDFYETTVSDQISENTFNKLLANDDKIGCLIACDKNEIPVGFLTYLSHFNTWKLNPVCYINDLFVCHEHRKNGITKLLFREVKKLSEQNGWSQIYWLTKPDNTIARTLYDKIAKGQAWIEYVMN